ncbi:MAG: hypothetical protein EAZ91_04955 [Cytophagales bacterium]|nr:MAG: hypothetical protein EAZ91_04955 [Cytophagales bacterium]
MQQLPVFEHGYKVRHPSQCTLVTEPLIVPHYSASVSDLVIYLLYLSIDRATMVTPPISLVSFISTTTMFKITLALCLLLGVILAVSCKKQEEALPKSSEKLITKFSFLQFMPAGDAIIDAATKQITATVPSSADPTKLIPSISVSAKAKVLPESGKVHDFAKPVAYTVTAEDGTTSSYTVTVTRTKSNSKEIISFSFNDFTPAVVATIDPAALTIKATLPATANLANLRPTIKLSDGATSDPATGVYSDFSRIAPFVVTAENGTTQTYSVQLEKELLITSGKLPTRSVIYVSNSDGFELNAVDALTGTKLWTFNNKGVALFANPTIYDGNVILPSYGVKFIDCSSGVQNGLIPSDFLGESSPVVQNDILYYGSGTDGYLRAFDLKTKKMKWSAYADYWVNSSPTILKNYVIVSIENVNVLDAYDLETGTLKWRNFRVDGRTNPCTFENTVIAAGRGQLRAYDVDSGRFKWIFNLVNSSVSSPTQSDGVVYVGSNDANAYAINASDGTLKWKFKTGGNIDSSPIVAGQLVYFYCKDSFLYALDKTTGAEKWKFKIGQPSNYNEDRVNSSPVVVDGVVYIQGVDAVLYALNATTGSKIWQFNEAGVLRYSSPCVIDKAGKIYHSGLSGLTN